MGSVRGDHLNINNLASVKSTSSSILMHEDKIKEMALLECNIDNSSSGNHKNIIKMRR